VTLYFLPDDRNVRKTVGAESDADEDASDALGRTRLALAAERVVLWGRLSRREESHHLNIEPVLNEVNTWFRSHAYRGSNTGEENATSIYLQVVEQIARLTDRSSLPDIDYEAKLVRRLQDIGNRIGAFTRFGLIAPFPADKFLNAFSEARGAARGTIATVLEPYINGIEARLNALEEIRSVVTTYVESTNSFLTTKSLSFTLQEGAVIRGFRDNLLSPNLLSSGEKQLILLLSNTILVREEATIFLIDEPELSLNVKWQRQLIDALLQCATGAHIQYLLASHSIELITQYRHNATRLMSEEGTYR
jgi:predicted ATPase